MSRARRRRSGTYACSGCVWERKPHRNPASSPSVLGDERRVAEVREEEAREHVPHRPRRPTSRRSPRRRARGPDGSAWRILTPSRLQTFGRQRLLRRRFAPDDDRRRAQPPRPPRRPLACSAAALDRRHCRSSPSPTTASPSDQIAQPSTALRSVDDAHLRSSPRRSPELSASAEGESDDRARRGPPP